MTNKTKTKKAGLFEYYDPQKAKGCKPNPVEEPPEPKPHGVHDLHSMSREMTLDEIVFLQKVYPHKVATLMTRVDRYALYTQGVGTMEENDWLYKNNQCTLRFRVATRNCLLMPRSELDAIVLVVPKELRASIPGGVGENSVIEHSEIMLFSESVNEQRLFGVEARPSINNVNSLLKKGIIEDFDSFSRPLDNDEIEYLETLNNHIETQPFGKSIDRYRTDPVFKYFDAINDWFKQNNDFIPMGRVATADHVLSQVKSFKFLLLIPNDIEIHTPNGSGVSQIIDTYELPSPPKSLR